MRRSRNRWFGWWYLALSTGFLMLTLDHIVVKDSGLGIGVRAAIAAGFGLLSWMELNKK